MFYIKFNRASFFLTNISVTVAIAFKRPTRYIKLIMHLLKVVSVYTMIILTSTRLLLKYSNHLGITTELESTSSTWSLIFKVDCGRYLRSFVEMHINSSFPTFPWVNIEMLQSIGLIIFVFSLSEQLPPSEGVHS